MTDDAPAIAIHPSIQALADALSAGLLMHRGGRVLFSNRAAQELTGYSRDALAQMEFWQLFEPRQQREIRERGLARLQGEAEPACYEARLVRRDGEVRWVELTASVSRIAGVPTALGSIIDVSERKQAEAAWFRMQSFTAQIIEGDPVPTLVIDAAHRVTHWNHACAEVTGVSAASMVGSSEQWQAFYPARRPILADLIVSGEADALMRHYGNKKLRRSPVVPDAYEAEDFFPHFGDKGRWLYFTAAPIRDADGRIIGAIESLQDISERKEAEAQLRLMQGELEALVEKRTSQLKAAKDALEQDIHRREEAEEELLRRYAELTGLNIRLQETQQQLVQSEKLASIGQLAAGVAHEINNPIGYVNSNLRTLGGYVQQLMSVLAAYRAQEASLPEAARAAVETAKQAADFEYLCQDIQDLLAESSEGTERVRKIVQDLRDFSRVDTTQEWQRVDLHHGIDSTLNIARNEIKYRADVVKDYGPLPMVECLQSQINQVLMNLFVNAAQAIPEGRRGTITVRTRAEGDQVSITVEDDGQGIPQENLDRIFEPFFTTKPVGRGTGLGLSLSYGIVQRHRGRIDVCSTLGVGTAFRILLPVSQSEAATLAEPAVCP